MSENSEFQIHLRQPSNSCVFNSYFEAGLKTWDAHTDIQPVMSEHKAISSVCVYGSETENSC